MTPKKWSFPVLKAAKWTSYAPDSVSADSAESTKFEDWVLWVRAGDLPLDLPLDPNARHPNIDKPTPRAIAETLRDAPGEFVKRNNGICMVAQACHLRDNQASLVLNTISEEEEREDGRRGDGILNGGHTYAVLRALIQEAITLDGKGESPSPDPRDAVVRIEVQTGVTEDELADISRARNKSEPVAEFSLKNLGNAWQDIKKVLSKEVRSRVAFMENDPDAPDALYDVGDLIRLLALFNNRVYPADKKEPISAYTSEKRLIANWKRADYEHLLQHLPELIELHDEAVKMFPEVMKVPGNVSGVVKHEKKPLVLLSGKKSKYFIPPPFTFPVLAALRVFLADDGSRWIVPPATLVKDPRYMRSLVTETWTQYKAAGRHSAAFFGRNKQVWRMLALTAMVKRQSVAA